MSDAVSGRGVERDETGAVALVFVPPRRVDHGAPRCNSLVERGGLKADDDVAVDDELTRVRILVARVTPRPHSGPARCARRAASARRSCCGWHLTISRQTPERT